MHTAVCCIGHTSVKKFPNASLQRWKGLAMPIFFSDIWPKLSEFTLAENITCAMYGDVKRKNFITVLKSGCVPMTNLATRLNIPSTIEACFLQSSRLGSRLCPRSISCMQSVCSTLAVLDFPQLTTNQSFALPLAAKGTFRFETTQYTNVTRGIEDPSIFTPPTSCVPRPPREKPDSGSTSAVWSAHKSSFVLFS